MSIELTALINRYQQLLTQPFIPNTYYNSETQYKNEIREKIKELKQGLGNSN